jgi:hypothetical protein
MTIPDRRLGPAVDCVAQQLKPVATGKQDGKQGARHDRGMLEIGVDPTGQAEQRKIAVTLNASQSRLPRYL